MKITARQIAFNVLSKIFKDNAYSNIALDFALKKSNAEQRERAFASTLVYGTVERMITLDYVLVSYLSKPLKKLKPDVLTILRLGAYQILFLDSVPNSAAVNESVKLAKNNGCSYAAGLINAVLRKVSQNGLILPESQETLKYLGVKYSCPQWLVEKWQTEYGYDCTENILAYSLKENHPSIRVNTLKTTTAALIELLNEKGIDCKTTHIKDSLIVDTHSLPIEELEEFQDGLFHVQGLPSQLCAKALGAKPDDTVFDLCAAPGGKTFTVAQYMQNRGTLKAFDIYSGRVDLINNGKDRLGLNIITAFEGDASVFDDSLGYADCVLCDVPCSGLGIISKKPEIKFKSPTELEALPKLQLAILENGSRYVKPGGRLLYSTCTLSRAENEDVCEKFLKHHPEFVAEKPLPELSNEKFKTFFPNENNSDGFFVALFIKKG